MPLGPSIRPWGWRLAPTPPLTVIWDALATTIWCTPALAILAHHAVLMSNVEAHHVNGGPLGDEVD